MKIQDSFPLEGLDLLAENPLLSKNVVPGWQNPTKHHRSRGSMQKQWGTLLQAQAGTPSTQPSGHAERAPSDGGDLFLHPIVGKPGSLGGLVSSLTKDVLLVTDWWVRVRGWGASCPPLIGSLSFFVSKFCSLSSGGGFTFHTHEGRGLLFSQEVPSPFFCLRTQWEGAAMSQERSPHQTASTWGLDRGLPRLQSYRKQTSAVYKAPRVCCWAAQTAQCVK